MTTSPKPPTGEPDDVAAFVKTLRLIARGVLFGMSREDAGDYADCIERLERELEESLRVNAFRYIMTWKERAVTAEAALADALRSNVQFEATLKDAQDFNDTLEAALATALEKVPEATRELASEPTQWLILCKLLREIADGKNAQDTGQDVILIAAANTIQRFKHERDNALEEAALVAEYLHGWGRGGKDGAELAYHIARVIRTFKEQKP